VEELALEAQAPLEAVMVVPTPMVRLQLPTLALVVEVAEHLILINQVVLVAAVLS
jgi:hypothetical protein